ncbi:MAG: hypothetical protein O7E49_07330 [Gemmatimonadetes bacterium]|nr:hypothetical protein [Gemmatimonadota bacterium]
MAIVAGAVTARGYAQRGTGDSIAPPAATDLPGGGGMVFSFIQRTYTLAPSEGAGHRVLLVYAIPARRLGGTERGEPILARVRLSLIATPEDTVVLTDTVRVLQELATAEDRYAIGLEELNLPPGRHYLRLYLGTWDSRIGLEAGLPAVMVDDLQHTRLWLSDLVLGRQGAGLAWQRDESVVAIDPLNTYQQGSSIEVYYELVGLPEGAPFETTISLTPMLAYNPVVEEDLDPLVSFGYDEVASSRFTALRRTFSLGNFPVGRYRLTVTARIPGGDAVTRTTMIRVLE